MSLGLINKQADNLDDIVGTGKQLWQQVKDTFKSSGYRLKQVVADTAGCACATASPRCSRSVSTSRCRSGPTPVGRRSI